MIKNKFKVVGDIAIVECKLGTVLLDSQDAINMPDRTIFMHINKKYAAFKLNGKLVKVHRYLLGVVGVDQVDHINIDPMDNRRSNLRVCSNAQNCKNRSNRRNSKIKYRGVHMTAQGNYMARIQISPQKRVCLGRFDTIEEAAEVYNKAAVEHHGEFARLNTLKA